MTRFLTLREASRAFSSCVRAVEFGETVVITRNGTPVAKLVPIGTNCALSPERAGAVARTEARMSVGWSLGAGRLNRDELHER